MTGPYSLPYYYVRDPVNSSKIDNLMIIRCWQRRAGSGVLSGGGGGGDDEK